MLCGHLDNILFNEKSKEQNSGIVCYQFSKKGAYKYVNNIVLYIHRPTKGMVNQKLIKMVTLRRGSELSGRNRYGI